MPIWLETIAWMCRGFALALLVLTLLPFIHTGWWVARAADFPRVQLCALSLTLAVVVCILGFVTHWSDEPWLLSMACATMAAWQVSHTVRFTPLVSKVVQSADAAELVLVVANLDFRNEQKPDCLAALQKLDADIYLLVEVDDEWVNALEPLRATHVHRIEDIRGEGLGLAVWSRFPLHDGCVQYLVSDKRPSIQATISTGAGDVTMIGIHPTPPGLPVRGDDGRHDSRIRDAELMLVAKHVASDPDRRWIVAGDFNDVAWSRTTALFVRESGLLDPRVGRKLLNTYHADRPLMRYPLDHVFVSKGMKVGEFERARVPGSDHFAVRAAFSVPGSPDGAEPDGDGRLNGEARGMIDEGRNDAARLGRSAGAASAPA